MGLEETVFQARVFVTWLWWCCLSDNLCLKAFGVVIYKTPSSSLMTIILSISASVYLHRILIHVMMDSRRIVTLTSVHSTSNSDVRDRIFFEFQGVRIRTSSRTSWCVDRWHTWSRCQSDRIMDSVAESTVTAIFAFRRWRFLRLTSHADMLKIFEHVKGWISWRVGWSVDWW